MNVAWGLGAFAPRAGPAAVALGTFDGLHRGHQAVVAALRSAAARDGGEAVAITFDPHPVSVIAPPRGPFLLTTLEERIELFAAIGVDTLVVVRFDERLREVPAVAWLELLVGRLGAGRMVVSSTHTFGRNREGTAALLQAWAAPRGIAVTVVPPVGNGGAIISSTGIRERLREGDVATAAEWLGRWYAVRGPVVAGEGRGRQLGTPTANLRVPSDKVVPGRGVYAGYATVAGRTHLAAVNVGVRPTFGEDGLPTIEAHLLDAGLDLYGQTLEVSFAARLREERRFPTAEALRAQLASDLAEVRRRLPCLERLPAE